MRYRKLDPRKLNVSGSYQRLTKSSMVKSIRKDYREEAFGCLTVGEREDGTFWVVDGQTRLEAVLGISEVKLVPCVVFDSTGEKNEAEMFRMVNHQRPMKHADKINALIKEGDPQTVAMLQVVEGVGFRLAFRGERDWPYIRAIGAVSNLDKWGVLERTLEVAMEWGDGDVSVLHALSLEGIGQFLQRYGELVDEKRLIKCLSRYTLTKLAAMADAGKMVGGNRRKELAVVIARIYNKGLRESKRLEVMHDG